MRSTIVLLSIFYSSICFAQTDSMFVEKMDGTIRGYPISLISQILFSGTPTSVRDQELVQSVLTSFTLHQNYPNPFNPSTTIEYEIPNAGLVDVMIFDIQGRLVRSLEKSHQQAGYHRKVWDGRNTSGTAVATGVYFYQVRFNGSALTKKLAIIK